ncbi:MAG: MFS transporter [Alphaproteobacteria bacterium]|nr:MFS transporter [Alphaproteobacteria bacterium]
MSTASTRSTLDMARHFRDPRIALLFWIGAAMNAGLWVHTLLVAWALAGGALPFASSALVQTAISLPALLVLWPAGIVGDHVTQRTLLVLALLFGSLTSVAAAVMSVFGNLLAALLATTFLYAAALAVAMPALSAAMIHRLAADEAVDATTLINMSLNIGRIVGSAAAGLAALLWNAELALELTAIILGVLALGTGRARAWEAMQRAAAGVGGRARPTPTTFPSAERVLPAMFLCALPTSSIVALLPAVVHQDPALDISVLGWLLAAFPAGGCAALMLTGPIIHRLGLRTATTVSCLAMAAAIAMISAAPGIVSLAIAVTLSGTVWNVLHSLLCGWALGDAAERRKSSVAGRYLACAACGQTIGGFLWGGLAEAMGPGPALAIATVPLVLASILIAAPRPSLSGRRGAGRLFSGSGRVL